MIEQIFQNAIEKTYPTCLLYDNMTNQNKNNNNGNRSMTSTSNILLMQVVVLHCCSGNRHFNSYHETLEEFRIIEVTAYTPHSLIGLMSFCN